ncbi:glycosyltransferase family 2 protein [Laribacter hongkongensis]|uniref:glycosyltransferase family 2 protein n=1 Tax=Laribacter hongkongensis TaxID=168471 RepID=UPI001EFD0463|nr:glycosyltransferase [Laribacter hongkongensis]MCG9098087.1 glycosyltransferase [Laribacter hongkongensis]
MEKKLSICITTYNRSKYLDCCLRSIYQQLMSAGKISLVNVIVSDNCSTDLTSDVVLKYKNLLDLKYLVSQDNYGYETNYGSAISMASAKYSLYLSDDDLLDIESVFEIVDFMEGNPSVSAVYAPWRLVDLTSGKDCGEFYHVEKLTAFEKESYEKVLNFVLDGHVFPEIGIYRNYSNKKIAFTVDSIAWCAFVQLRNALSVGDVVFWPNNFYAAVVNYFPDLAHGHEGNKDTMYKWDTYRGGVEVLLAAARVDPVWMSFYALKINKFTAIRMSVGLRLRLAAGVGCAVENYYLAARVAAYGVGLPICGKDISMMARLEYIAKSRQIHNHRKGLYVVDCMNAALAEELNKLNPCSWFVGSEEFDSICPDDVVVLLMNNAKVCWKGEGNCYISEDDLELMFPEI